MKDFLISTWLNKKHGQFLFLLGWNLKNLFWPNELLLCTNQNMYEMTCDSKINLLTDVFDCYRLIKGKTNKQPLQQKQSSFQPDWTKNMGNSCFCLAEIWKIFSGPMNYYFVGMMYGRRSCTIFPYFVPIQKYLGNIYREPSINSSYQVLASGFRGEDI
jgi:hypothetical protein